MDDAPFKTGDVVRLKSVPTVDGLAMTVKLAIRGADGFDTDKLRPTFSPGRPVTEVCCIWFDRDLRLQEANLPPDMLVKVNGN